MPNNLPLSAPVVEFVRSTVDGLTAGAAPERWSSVKGACGFYSARMRKALAGLGLPTRIAHVKDIGYHYHVRLPGDTIVCPTWQQWIHGEKPSALPRVFVGTRDQLAELLEPFSALLLIDPLRQMEGNLPATPGDLVDEQYGFGEHEKYLLDATVQQHGLLNRPPAEFLLAGAKI
ncbi:MAG TPA: hypothetical protein PKV72_06575 [Candidatus Peribacteria bacterium]|nr:hypothetical protein [Candidatus Peribacteria bacterium]